MRILLASAVAIAPLMVAMGAQAETVVSNTRSTPISTANATGNAADTIRISNSGVVNVPSGAAVTLNSSHSVTVDSGGQISMVNAADGATGILAEGGNTGSIRIGGSISIADSLTEYPDDDKDGVPNGPWAAGTNRAGVRVVGSQPLTGDLTVESGGAILVDGNQSYGISVESGLVGTLKSLGTIRVLGDETVGVRTTSTVTGGVDLGGTITARGEDAEAVNIGGDVTGRLRFQGDISASGYRLTSRPNDTIIANLKPDQLLQGGSAVVIGGNVGGGVLFDVVPTPPKEGEPALVDPAVGAATINSYGSAAAVRVGSADRSITLGAVGTAEKEAYGFINRGQIIGSGVFDEVASNSVVFGGDAGQTVNIVGGVRNEGTMATLSYEADATTVRFGQGAIAPRFDNAGNISAASSTEDNSWVTAIQIDAGANLSSLTNSNSILATSGGGAADVAAIRDQSGTLTSITNTKSIQATLSPNSANDAITGTTTAIDVRANTTGVTFTQYGIASEATATDPDTDGDGVTDSNEPMTYGDILLGSGADVLDIRNGVVVGDISFGAGADRLAISGGAYVRGALDTGDGQLDIDIGKGTLEARNGSAATVSSLNVGSEGNLIVSVDPAQNTSGGLNVTGAANLASGAGLGVRFNSLLDDPTRFTVIKAGSLTVGDIDFGKVADNSPYLFVVEAQADTTAGEVYIDARRRTAEEAGMIKAEAAAFDAIYQGIDDNEALRNAFLNQTGRDGFINLYEQMLPDHSGGPLLSLASGVDAVTRALTGRNAIAEPGQTSAWLQEINFYADKDKTESYGFRSEGFGLAGGVERGTNLGAFGVTAAFTSSDLKDPEAEAEEILSASLLELGLYWRAQGQYWTTWARAAAGYASFDATRQLVADGLNLKNESSWHGYTLAAAGGASYERHFGRVNIRPEVYAEYFSLNEDARTETGGGDGFDLDIDKRDGHMFSAVAAMNVGYGFGKDGWIRPELRVGWRQNISVDAGSTIARFASGGPDFILDPASIEGGGPILGFRLNVGNDLGMLSITGDAELLEDYVRYTLLLRASFRF